MVAKTTGEQRPRKRGRWLAVGVGVLVLGGVAVVGGSQVVEQQQWNAAVARYEEKVAAGVSEETSSREQVEGAYVGAQEDLAAAVVEAGALFVSSDGSAPDSDRIAMAAATSRAKLVGLIAPSYNTTDRTVAGISQGSNTRPSRTFLITTSTTPAVSEIEAELVALQTGMLAVTSGS